MNSNDPWLLHKAVKKISRSSCPSPSSVYTQPPPPPSSYKTGISTPPCSLQYINFVTDYKYPPTNPAPTADPRTLQGGKARGCILYYLALAVLFDEIWVNHIRDSGGKKYVLQTSWPLGTDSVQQFILCSTDHSPFIFQLVLIFISLIPSKKMCKCVIELHRTGVAAI